MGQSWPLFRLFLSFSHCNKESNNAFNFNDINWRKFRWFVWDSNQGPQDGRLRQKHGATATALFQTVNLALAYFLLFTSDVISFVFQYILKECHLKSSGGGSVGKAVTSDTRRPQFESQHRQSFYWIMFTVNCIEKTKIRKRGREWPIFLTYFIVVGW